MYEFLKAQLDYIYFFYGLSFIVLAGVCYIMQKKDGFPWKWLALFGLTHGLNEWLDLIAFSFGDNNSFAMFRYLVIAVSFVFLVEFGRTASGSRVGRWIFLPLLALALSGCISGKNGTFATTRYFLGLVGGLWSAAALYMAAQRAEPMCARRWLYVSSAALGAYALSSGGVVPKAEFFPASLINYESFAGVFGFPVQLFRGVMAMAIAASLWACSQVPSEAGADIREHEERARNTFWPAFVLLVIIAAGWGFTVVLGNDHKTYRMLGIFVSFFFCLSAITFFLFINLAKEPDEDSLIRRYIEFVSDRLLFFGFAFGASFWFLDSAINSFVFKEGSFIDQMFYPGMDCFWMRSFTFGTFVMFSAYSQFIVTERRRAEKGLAEEQLRLAAERERLSVTLKSIGDGVIATDASGNVVLLNKVAEELTGWSQGDAAGRPLDEVFDIINEQTRIKCVSPVEKVLKTGGTVGLANHTALLSKDGAERAIADSGAPIKDAAGNTVGVVLVFRDVTERRKMEEDMLRTQKIESLGVLAGGIAHDFNNILTAILNSVSIAKLSAEPESKTFKWLASAEKATLKAQGLTHQLLTFATGGAPVRKAASMKELIEESAGFALRGSNVSCKYIIPDALWHANVDEGQISQVISNLIINACQAMPSGGVIHIVAENFVAKKDGHLPLNEGRYIMLSIRDTGLGIPKEHLSKIFDPYFTTKQKGSGLGLTSAWSIVNKHGGHIAVESELGAGTTFTVFLPASEEEPERRADEETSFAGNGKILVMDDEEDIRKSLGHILSHFGYDVEFAGEGDKAVALYREAMNSGEPFDAVILDLTVPGGMGGEETIKRLRELDPDVRAIVSSGYSMDSTMSEYEKYGFSGVITKPYRLEDLGRELHRVLSA